MAVSFLIISLYRQNKIPDFNFYNYRLHLRPPKVGRIAQLVERRTENPCVASSILAPTTFLFPFFQHISYSCDKQFHNPLKDTAVFRPIPAHL